MKVFVTGASGWIGSAVVPELIAAGHEVVGLARSDASAQAITAMGATALRGHLGDLDSLRAGARQSDGVIQLAFGNDFSNFVANIEEETLALQTLGAGLEGSNKPFIFASGTPRVAGRPSTEADPMLVEGPLGGRARNALYVLGLADRGVRSATVRLPRSVHDAAGRYGFSSILIQAAQGSGVSGFVGDGSQRWPAVHRLDAARLFRLALEEAEPGTVLHAVGDEGDTMLSIAETIGHRLEVPIQEVPGDIFGVLGAIFSEDQPSSSALTQQRFAWRPTHPSLLEDLATGIYP